jgi:hypothetical protein
MNHERTLNTPGIFIVDADLAMRVRLEAGLRQEGFAVWQASDGREALTCTGATDARSTWYCSTWTCLDWMGLRRWPPSGGSTRKSAAASCVGMRAPTPTKNCWERGRWHCSTSPSAPTRSRRFCGSCKDVPTGNPTSKQVARPSFLGGCGGRITSPPLPQSNGSPLRPPRRRPAVRWCL